MFSELLRGVKWFSEVHSVIQLQDLHEHVSYKVLNYKDIVHKQQQQQLYDEISFS